MGGNIRMWYLCTESSGDHTQSCIKTPCLAQNKRFLPSVVYCSLQGSCSGFWLTSTPGGVATIKKREKTAGVCFSHQLLVRTVVATGRERKPPQKNSWKLETKQKSSHQASDQASNNDQPKRVFCILFYTDSFSVFSRLRTRIGFADNRVVRVSAMFFVANAQMYHRGLVSHIGVLRSGHQRYTRPLCHGIQGIPVSFDVLYWLLPRWVYAQEKFWAVERDIVYCLLGEFHRKHATSTIAGRWGYLEYHDTSLPWSTLRTCTKAGIFIKALSRGGRSSPEQLSQLKVYLFVKYLPGINAVLQVLDVCIQAGESKTKHANLS